MALWAKYGFDPERSVMLRNISSSTTLREVRKAFAQEDKVSQIAWVEDELIGGGGMLCEFEECITPYLLDGEHLNAEGNDYWKVVQIDESFHSRIFLLVWEMCALFIFCDAIPIAC